MPFTLAHAAAVLPLLRTRLTPSALVVGSMAPDLVYFALLRPVGGRFTHGPVGLLVLGLPLAVLVLVLWHAFTVHAFLAVAPAAVRARVGPVAPAPRPGVRVLASILVGAVTHLLWDAFTHHDGYVVGWGPWLREDVWPTGLPAYEVLQLGGSAGGLAVLAWWGALWVRRTEPGVAGPGSWRARVVIGVVAVAFATGNALSESGAAWVAPTLASIGLVTGAFLGLVGYGVALRAGRVAAARPGCR
ncbi:DUF4184 family protein [Actinokineospora sp. G85]|uniref:DUF4184 family protein n=1 Tax=Actinokineospora sp. G85 TaxID=3406626 RepID=UPI003C7569AE